MEKETKDKEPQLFYANADKLKRAKAKGKNAKEIKAAYEAMGGTFTAGYGLEPA